MNATEYKRCSCPTTSLKHSKRFEEVLCLNGYSEINRSSGKLNHHNKPDTAKWLYFKLPFIFEKIDWKCVQDFQK